MTQKIIRVLSIVLFTCLSTFIATSASAVGIDLSKITEKGGIIATISIWSEYNAGGALVFPFYVNDWVGYQYEKPKQGSMNDVRSTMYMVSGGNGHFLLKSTWTGGCLTAASPYFKHQACRLGDPAQMWFMQPVKGTSPNGGIPSQYHFRLASDPNQCLSGYGARNEWPKLGASCPKWGHRISVGGYSASDSYAGANIDAELKHLAATYAVHRCGSKQNFGLCELEKESSSLTEWGPNQCLALWRNTTSTAGIPGNYKFIQSYTSSFLTSEKTTNGWKIGATLSLNGTKGGGRLQLNTTLLTKNYSKIHQQQPWVLKSLQMDRFFNLVNTAGLLEKH